MRLPIDVLMIKQRIRSLFLVHFRIRVCDQTENQVFALKLYIFLI